MFERYVNQARLLVRILPDVAKEDVFALKGGTAINLFYRDMPRLSVDIDLTYLPVDEREKSLKDIDRALERIAVVVAKRNPSVRTQRIAGRSGHDTRIMVSDSRAEVKIETSPVMRGSVYPPLMKATHDSVVAQFGFVEMNVLGFEDLYGGKIHAALSRQHPRDFFDVKMLYENEGFGDKLFRVLMVYVAGSRRPMHELLAPKASFHEALYFEEFNGMTREMVTREEMIVARERLHADIRRRLTGDIAKFLLSLHDGEPDFDLIDLPEAAKLPAVRWKIKNLDQLKRNNPRKHAEQRGEIERLLGR